MLSAGALDHWNSGALNTWKIFRSETGRMRLPGVAPSDSGGGFGPTVGHDRARLWRGGLPTGHDLSTVDLDNQVTSRDPSPDKEVSFFLVEVGGRRWRAHTGGAVAFGFEVVCLLWIALTFFPFLISA